MSVKEKEKNQMMTKKQRKKTEGQTRPYSFCALGFAPCSKNNFTASVCFQAAAQCKPVCKKQKANPSKVFQEKKKEKQKNSNIFSSRQTINRVMSKHLFDSRNITSGTPAPHLFFVPIRHSKNKIGCKQNL